MREAVVEDLIVRGGRRCGGRGSCPGCAWLGMMAMAIWDVTAFVGSREDVEGGEAQAEDGSGCGV